MFIKRKYKQGECIKAGEWYISTRKDGKLTLCQNYDKDCYVGDDKYYIQYVVDQDIAAKLFELPLEPQDGEVWFVRDVSVNSNSVAMYVNYGFYWEVRDGVGKSNMSSNWIPVRKVGRWKE